MGLGGQCPCRDEMKVVRPVFSGSHVVVFRCAICLEDMVRPMRRRKPLGSHRVGPLAARQPHSPQADKATAVPPVANPQQSATRFSTFQ
jgi:hypothetical protein